MKNLILLGFTLISLGSFSQNALGEVIGEVVEFTTGESLVDAVAYINDNGAIYRAKTDLDGRFRIAAVPAGFYLLNIKKGGDTLKNIQVEVIADGLANVGKIEFNSGHVAIMGPMYVKVSDQGLKLIDGNLPVLKMSAKEIEASPVKFDLTELINSMSSEVRKTDDGQLVFRGARKGDMIYLIDGVKTRDAGSVPSISIGNVMVYTGALPAKYGDTLGGVVVMESKSYFDLYRRWEASQLGKQ